MKHLDVAIIGAGSAGLTARRVVAEKTDSYRVFDGGLLGTTCARVGCMPSKVLIQVANDFERRKSFEAIGIQGGEGLALNDEQAMAHVRSLRDRFVRGVLHGAEDWMKSHLVRENARFVSQKKINGFYQIEAGNEIFGAKKVIIATGSRPFVPEPFLSVRDHLITTDEFFELSKLPKKMAVIGLGVIGVELGQALHRLGVEVVGLTLDKAIGGLTDPEIQEEVFKNLSKEFHISTDGAHPSGVNSEGLLVLKSGAETFTVEKALMAVGRKPNLDRLGLDIFDFEKTERGLPKVNPNTMQIQGLDDLFLAGDVNGERPLLHEAADEGFIAGFNAANGLECFQRRTFLGITFSDPNVAIVGESHRELKKRGANFVTGRVRFAGQGRSIVKLKEMGLLHIYADKGTGRILGAELQAPDGEHLAHLIAWAISLKLTIKEALTLPFYHPVVEEGLRTALRDAAKQVDQQSSSAEVLRCSDSPIR